MLLPTSPPPSPARQGKPPPPPPVVLIVHEVCSCVVSLRAHRPSGVPRGGITICPVVPPPSSAPLSSCRRSRDRRFPIVLRSEFCCCLTERSSCRQTSVVSLCRRTFVVSLCRRTSVVCRRTSNISSNAVRRRSRPTRRRSPPGRRNRNLPGRVLQFVRAAVVVVGFSHSSFLRTFFILRNVCCFTERSWLLNVPHNAERSSFRRTRFRL